MKNMYNISIEYGSTPDTDKLRLTYYKTKDSVFITTHDSYGDVMNQVDEYSK